MIRRIVVFKMKEEALGASAWENAEKLAGMFNNLKNHLDFLVDIKAGVCAKDTYEICGYNMGLTVTYACKEDIEKYTVHPEHQKVKNFVGEIIETRTMVDYEI